MKKALIISVNAVGDAYLSASAIPIIKGHFKKEICEIHFVCSSDAEFLVSDLDILKIHTIKSKNIFSVLNLLFNLRENEYEVIICPFPGRINSILYSLCKGINRAGFINFKKSLTWDDKISNLNVNNSSSNKVWKPGENFLKRVRLCLDGVGIISTDKLSKLRFPDIEKERIPESKYAVCHFNSRITEKNIDTEIIEYLFDKLIKSGLKVKLIDPAKEFKTEKKVEKIKKSSLGDLLNLINSAEVFIGIDSFPIHLADAYNKKIIGLFTISDPLSIFSDPNGKYSIDANQDKYKIYQYIDAIFNSLIC